MVGSCKFVKDDMDIVVQIGGGRGMRKGLAEDTAFKIKT